jgi:3-dehydroquinate synthase
MYASFEITSSTGTYGVHLGAGQVSRGAASPSSSACQIVDDTVAQLWPAVLMPDAIRVVATEDFKTLDTVAVIIGKMRAAGMSRASHLYACGGGIIQDLATFAASCYQRGISWSYCPTTLLGMVDSCIGGKSSINVAGYKNIAGNFYPPRDILIDVAFCRTLPPVELMAGLCEAVKICFAARGDAFSRYLSLFSDPAAFLSERQLLEVVALSLGTKKTFIEEDEFDRGVRLLLNFGHTFGHAIETGTHFAITHGVAVGIGMLAEISLSRHLGRCPQANSRIDALEGHLRGLLGRVPDLADHSRTLSVPAAIEGFKSDKKHAGGRYSVILATSDGTLERASLPITSELDGVVMSIFERLARGDWS